MRRTRHLAAGLLDSAFAALGTFLAGILAVRELDVRLLAVYAVIAAAAVFAMPLARQLVYLPSQVAANVLSEVRVPVLRHEVRRALPWSAASAAIVLAVGCTLLPVPDRGGVLVLAGTAALMVVVSPLQDHVRSCLHLVGRHFAAATCSIVLAVVVGAVVAIASVVPHPPGAIAAVPFGALTLANLVSAATGVLLLRRAVRADVRSAPFADRGRFLLSELSIQGAWLGCTYLILGLAGAAAVASLEAARLTAAPVFILSGALSTFVAPALLRRLNPERPDRRGAVRELLVAVAVLAVGVVLWLAVLTLAGGLVSAVLNKPFDLALVALRCAASVLEGIAALVSIALLALTQARASLLFSLLAAGIGLVGTALLAPVGAFALPLAQSAGSVVRLALSARTGSRALGSRVEQAQAAALQV